MSNGYVLSEEALKDGAEFMRMVEFHSYHRWSKKNVDKFIGELKAYGKKHGAEAMGKMLVKETYPQEKVSFVSALLKNGYLERVNQLLRLGLPVEDLIRTENGLKNTNNGVDELYGQSRYFNHDLREKFMGHIGKIESMRPRFTGLLREELKDNTRTISDGPGITNHEDTPIVNALFLLKILKTLTELSNSEKKTLELCERKKQEEEIRRDEDRKANESFSKVEEARMVAMRGLAAADDLEGFVALGDLSNIWDILVKKRTIVKDQYRGTETAHKFSESILKSSGNFARCLMTLFEKGDDPWELTHTSNFYSPIVILEKMREGGKGTLTPRIIMDFVKICSDKDPEERTPETLLNDFIKEAREHKDKVDLAVLLEAAILQSESQSSVSNRRRKI